MDQEDRKAILEFYEGKPYKELAESFKSLKDRITDLKKEASMLQDEYDVLTTEIIPDKMAEDGFQTVSLADGAGRIELRPQAYCSTRAGQKEALFHWLQQHGFEDLITEVVNASTLKAFVKEQMELGNDVPPDEIVNYQPYIRATIVGVK